jgi:hypothetical protein
LEHGYCVRKRNTSSSESVYWNFEGILQFGLVKYDTIVPIELTELVNRAQIVVKV